MDEYDHHIDDAPNYDSDNDADIELTFIKDERGRVTHLVSGRTDKNFAAKRI